MGKREWITAAFLFAITVLGGWLWLGDSGANRAPAAVFTTLDGERIDLEDLHGQPVIVNFWATTCPGCVTEMPHLAALYEDYRDQGLILIGVAMHYDAIDDVERLTRRRGLPYTVVHDHDQAIAHAFGNVNLTPTTFVIDPEGRVVQHSIGDLDTERLERRIQGLIERKETI